MSYDPTLGRWISQDPIAFEGGDSNLYRYVGNAPTDFVDPTGLEQKPDGYDQLLQAAQQNGVSEAWVQYWIAKARAELGNIWPYAPDRCQAFGFAYADSVKGKDYVNVSLEVFETGGFFSPHHVLVGLKFKNGCMIYIDNGGTRAWSGNGSGQIVPPSLIPPGWKPIGPSRPSDPLAPLPDPLPGWQYTGVM